jgi:hypothetical protein
MVPALISIKMSERKTIIYFTKPGEGDADETMKAALERAKELGIRDIVVASTRGASALKALEIFKGYNVVIIPHVWGSKETGTQELPEETAEKIRSMGGRIVYAAHAFSGVNRAIQTKFDTMYPAGIIAQTLRLFGQGMKVVVEISTMAADAGAIRVDRDVIAIAGSGKGADTAVVIKPAYSHSLFEAVVREIIAKPREI